MKRLYFDPIEDVYFRWHLAYAREDTLNTAAFKRHITSSDGQLDGPGVQGIKLSELKLAEGSIPDSRNGVQAWLKEGCMSWIPKSTPIWGTVSEKRYLRERSSSGSFVFLVETFCFEIYVKS